MKRSIAVIIFNEESEKRADLKVITNTLYRMNMTLKVLINKTAEVIQESIEALTRIDADEILDIIFVIHAKQVKGCATKFSTVDGRIFDLNNNIINYILEVREFENKQKYIIFKINGQDNKDNLVPHNPKSEFRCLSYGLKTCTVWSDAYNFVESFFKELGDHRNLTRAIQNNRKLIQNVQTSSTTKDLKLDVPPANAELTSEFHEFVIG